MAGNELPEVLLDFKAFLGNKESHASENTWVAGLKDRMDAEFCRPRSAAQVPTRDEVVLVASGAAGQLTIASAELARVQSEIRAAFDGLGTATVPLRDLFEPVTSVEKIDRAKNYRLPGVKWWGGGTFIREEKIGKDIKASKLNKVSAGRIVYNRLFAFRGSFAVVPGEHDGCHMSGEFPTFKVREDVDDPVAVSAYVIHCLNSPQYLVEVDRDSTGSTKTSRNRYKEHRFLATNVAIPLSAARLKTLVALMDKASALRTRHGEILESLEGLNEGIAKMLPMGGDVLTDEKPDVLTRRKPEAAPAPAAPTPPPKGKRKQRPKS